jgi:hypothetical protein
MIANPCVEIQTSEEPRPAVPPWFAEVVIIVQYLATKGILDAFAQQIRLIRGRFGRYEPIDFLALLLGYAISGERTLEAFFVRVAPFGLAFMALFGRRCCPHRASFSRFLADVDRPCLEAFRTLFQQFSFAEGWTRDSIGGIFDRQGRRFIIFDVDATRQAARQRALLTAPELPSPRRRLDAVCAPGYMGRKRGEVVRTRTTALQMHTRQWIGTSSGKGNGDYRGELAHALQATTIYLEQFAFPPQTALIRLDGQYGDAAVIAQIMRTGMHLVTRGKAYQLLERPQIQQVLTHPPTASAVRKNTGEVVELFEGGWLVLGEDFPAVRVIVTRYLASSPDSPVKVGKRVGAWIYELFITTLEAESFVVEDVVDLYHGRGAFETVLAEEDLEEDPDRWCSYTECGQELWQIACQWIWNIRLSLGHAMQAGELRKMEWSPAKERPPRVASSDQPSGIYGPWQLARDSGRGQIPARAFTLHDEVSLRCPAGAPLWLSEVRQENAFTQRAAYVAQLDDCRPCPLREQCVARGAKGDRARRVSAVRHLLPTPSSVEPQTGLLAATHWVDVAGRALRRKWIDHWRSQYVEVFPLTEVQQSLPPPPRPPRALRSHDRWSWSDRLARNAWFGPPHLRITVAGVPAHLTTR